MFVCVCVVVVVVVFLFFFSEKALNLRDCLATVKISSKILLPSNIRW